MKIFDVTLYCHTANGQFQIRESVHEDELEERFQALSEKLGKTFENEGFFYTVDDIGYEEVVL